MVLRKASWELLPDLVRLEKHLLPVLGILLHP